VIERPKFEIRFLPAQAGAETNSKFKAQMTETLAPPGGPVWTFGF
jgi:hypothetical protein